MSCPPSSTLTLVPVGKKPRSVFLCGEWSKSAHMHISRILLCQIFGTVVLVDGFGCWMVGIFRSVIVALYPRSVPQVNVPRRRVVRSMFYRLRFDLRSKRSMYYFQLHSAFTLLQFLNLFVQNIDGWMALVNNNAVPTVYSSALAQQTRFICNL